MACGCGSRSRSLLVAHILDQKTERGQKMSLATVLKAHSPEIYFFQLVSASQKFHNLTKTVPSAGHQILKTMNLWGSCHTPNMTLTCLVLLGSWPSHNAKWIQCNFKCPQSLLWDSNSCLWATLVIIKNQIACFQYTVAQRKALPFHNGGMKTARKY